MKYALLMFSWFKYSWQNGFTQRSDGRVGRGFLGGAWPWTGWLNINKMWLWIDKHNKNQCQTHGLGGAGGDGGFTTATTGFGVGGGDDRLPK